MADNFVLQSSVSCRTDSLHVAMIMDGNGRWASRRGMPRAAGHRAGAGTVRRITEGARELGIGTLTLYAFSSDNWKRPRDEVQSLMNLFEEHLAGEVRRCLHNGIRLRIIGRRDRLRPSLRLAIARAEEVTAGCGTMELNLAVDYSSRHAITAAAGSPAADVSCLAGRLSDETAACHAVPDVDLLIRTGGEQRLSDFLLWECAYAELYFTDMAWPDFGVKDFRAALQWFDRRERRFGSLPAADQPQREQVR